MLSWIIDKNYSEEVGKHFGGVRLLDKRGGLVNGGGVDEVSFWKDKDIFSLSSEPEMNGFEEESGVGESSNDLSHC